MNEQNQKENRAEKLTDFGFSKVKEADKEKQVKAVFDQVAPKYDLMNDVLSFGMHRLWKQYAIDRAEIQPGMKVLDIAGGTGDMSLLVQKKLSGTGEVWLSDINHEMLKIGDERLKNYCVLRLKEYDAQGSGAQRNAAGFKTGRQTHGFGVLKTGSFDASFLRLLLL